MGPLHTAEPRARWLGFTIQMTFLKILERMLPDLVKPLVELQGWGTVSDVGRRLNP
jgi:hypothetical protein